MLDFFEQLYRFQFNTVIYLSVMVLLVSDIFLVCSETVLANSHVFLLYVQIHPYKIWK